MLLTTVASIAAAALWLMRDQIMRTVAFGMVRGVFELLRMLIEVKSHFQHLKKDKTWTYITFFESFVDKDPSRLFFIIAETGEEVTRSAVDQRANQIAHWARSRGLKQGDTVAQMMFNKWEFVACWIGMFKVGVTSGLLNTNLTGKSLLHSVDLAVKASSKKILIIDDEIAENIKSEIEELATMGIETVLWSELAEQSSSQSSARPAASERSQINDSDPMVLIYTSGTTGMPKASKISSTRYYSGGSILKVFCYLKPGARLYCCLPLYHSAAGLIGVSGVIKSGATMVLR
jgi:acyl-CoA synthetase (AMP-forming)/AMP-acid ligase II